MSLRAEFERRMNEHAKNQKGMLSQSAGMNEDETWLFNDAIDRWAEKNADPMIKLFLQLTTRRLARVQNVPQQLDWLTQRIQRLEVENRILRETLFNEDRKDEKAARLEQRPDARDELYKTLIQWADEYERLGRLPGLFEVQREIERVVAGRRAT